MKKAIVNGEKVEKWRKIEKWLKVDLWRRGR